MPFISDTKASETIVQADSEQFIPYPETVLLPRMLDGEVHAALKRQDLRVAAGAEHLELPLQKLNKEERRALALARARIRMPRVVVYGTVKLHGTHADIIFRRRRPSTGDHGTSRVGNLFSNEVYWIQSRNRIITAESDNLDTTSFLHPRIPTIRAAMYDIFPHASEIMIAGEYCGEAIQRGVALSQIPKCFVIFAIRVDGEWASKESWRKLTVAEEHRIYNILDFPTYAETVEFEDTEGTTERLMAHTLEIEERCPFAYQLAGVNGIGEGIVWTGSYEMDGLTHHVCFKTKGSKFFAKVPKPVGGPREVKEGVSGFTETVVHQARLDQGIDFLREHNLEESMKSLGSYMRWVSDDVKKEEGLLMEEMKLEWDDVSRAVTDAAKAFYVPYAKSMPK